VRKRYSLLLLGLICLAALALGQSGTEAAGLPRAHVQWAILNGSTCPTQPTMVCFQVKPGDSATADIQLTVLQTGAINPRLVLQSPNGSRVMRTDNTPMPSPMALGSSFTTTVTIDVPPGFRPSKASGRLYLADKGSVLVAPLSIRVDILHPTPVELAKTPVVVPTNHILLLTTRFNIRELTVVDKTNLTWTNKDVKQHAVRGLLCDSSLPYDPNFPCTPDPNAAAAFANHQCNQQPAGQADLPPDQQLPMLCIDSGPINPERNFTVFMTRPNPRQLLRYYLDDGLGVAENMTGYVTVK
jgi:hypothetical protein